MICGYGHSNLFYPDDIGIETIICGQIIGEHLEKEN